jgi:hypothetical protein
MITHSVDSIKEKRLQELRDEMNIRDYRVMKILRQQFGPQIETAYPGETDWYNDQVAKIHELEGRE